MKHLGTTVALPAILNAGTVMVGQTEIAPPAWVKRNCFRLSKDVWKTCLALRVTGQTRIRIAGLAILTANNATEEISTRVPNVTQDSLKLIKEQDALPHAQEVYTETIFYSLALQTQ
jgi:hypothetical protein